jgi:hypothetical protein
MNATYDLSITISNADNYDGRANDTGDGANAPTGQNSLGLELPTRCVRCYLSKTVCLGVGWRSTDEHHKRLSARILDTMGAPGRKMYEVAFLHIALVIREGHFSSTFHDDVGLFGRVRAGFEHDMRRYVE